MLLILLGLYKRRRVFASSKDATNVPIYILLFYYNENNQQSQPIYLSLCVNFLAFERRGNFCVAKNVILQTPKYFMPTLKWRSSSPSFLLRNENFMMLN